MTSDLRWCLFGLGLWTWLSTIGHAAAPVKPEVETRPASPLGNSAFTANGRIQPHGLPTKYWFEFGQTQTYGNVTRPQSLPPKRAAYYHETWDHGPAGWMGGMAGKDLVHHSTGGASAGFMRFREPSGDDPNHVDGIGTLHLTSYFYPATHPSETGLQGWLGGGDPDFRDADVTMFVRGVDFVPNGAELLWWTQSDNDVAKQLTPDWRRANWAYTGYLLTDALRSGKWERITYRLTNDSHAWTYGGHNVAQNRPNYAYDSINNSLGRVSCDFFHLLAFVNPQQRPTGAIDLDEFALAYRNYSLVHPANGGKLTSFPKDGLDDPATLTDGWRHGMDRSGKSAPNPNGPLEFVYAFQTPVTVQTIQLHQHAEWPCKDVEVQFSETGEGFQTIIGKAMPETSPGGPNFAFLLERNVNRKAVAVKIRLLSGYRSRHWGLGEIEVFGEGGVYATDDDWYHVNLDLADLQPGQTYHYRLVAENAAGTVSGPDATFTVPAHQKPHVVTGAAMRIGSETATVTGRLTPMGKKSRYYVEYGPDANYGHKTREEYGGLQITPRSVIVSLTGLHPDSTCHYRVVGVNEDGTTFGEDAVLRTKPR